MRSSFFLVLAALALGGCSRSLLVREQRLRDADEARGIIRTKPEHYFEQAFHMEARTKHRLREVMPNDWRPVWRSHRQKLRHERRLIRDRHKHPSHYNRRTPHHTSQLPTK